MPAVLIRQICDRALQRNAACTHDGQGHSPARCARGQGHSPTSATRRTPLSARACPPCRHCPHCGPYVLVPRPDGDLLDVVQCLKAVDDSAKDGVLAIERRVPCNRQQARHRTPHTAHRRTPPYSGGLQVETRRWRLPVPVARMFWGCCRQTHTLGGGGAAAATVETEQTSWCSTRRLQRFIRVCVGMQCIPRGHTFVCDEELRPVGVGPTVGHRHDAAL